MKAVQQFETTVASGERGRVFINVPFTPQAAWGESVRYVKGTLNKVEYHASLGVRGGQYFMPLNKELQAQANLKPGDSVSVTMEPGIAQAEAVPEDFEQAIATEPKVQEFFSSLTAFQRNTYLDWISSAKKSETRVSRIQESVELLRSGKKQR
jgi:hypothetical protein